MAEGMNRFRGGVCRRVLVTEKFLADLRPCRHTVYTQQIFVECTRQLLFGLGDRTGSIQLNTRKNFLPSGCVKGDGHP